MKIKAFLIISKFNESFEWVKEYTDNYIIYNKGNPILNYNNHIYNTENIGGNQRDIFHFIISSYDNLPELVAFVQAQPFDHCKKEIFDELIQREVFTPLEYYGMIPSNTWENRTETGGYLEINNSWVIVANNATYKLSCRYNSFDDFMNAYFKNYVHLDWLRFSPGSQYIVEKKQILNYPKKFWISLMNELNVNHSTEGQLIERALYYIFMGEYSLKDIFYE